MSDVVAELDIWLNKDPWRGVLVRTTVQQARDEIMALRRQLAPERSIEPDTEDAITRRLRIARATALEEAARALEEHPLPVAPYIIAAIRALKEQP